jgi:pimeloyl-ACP methyl ester carboxylesterase
MTQWLERDGGRIAYSDEGRGPPVILVPGLGDLRQEYRFLAAALLQQGFRAVAMDLRGHGDSDTTFADFSPEAIGRDIVALIHELGATTAFVVGTSMAAGSAVWAAAEEPSSIAGLVLIAPFVRDVVSHAQQRLYRVLFRVLLARPWGVAFWMRYWTTLFPSRKPDDFDSYAAHLRESLEDPSRFEALRRMVLGASRGDIEARLERVRSPALVMMGRLDRDFADPAAEARLVAERLHGTVEMIDGAGHYPHVEFPERAARRVVAFLRGVSGPQPASSAWSQGAAG